tara:strand:+ start:1119 stop:1253 length:135 start_codon:yes stop_codon:yes gene_type:complete
MTFTDGVMIALLLVNVVMAYQLGKACNDIEILYQGLGSLLEDED